MRPQRVVALIVGVVASVTVAACSSDRTATTSSTPSVTAAATSTASPLTSPSPSPSVTSAPQGRIVFASVRPVFEGGPANNADIEVINADGSGLTNLTNSSGSDEIQPKWSPDGTKIVFARGSSPSRAHSIYVMNADGSGVSRLTAAAGFDDRSPSWSPDGARIAFARGSANALERVGALAGDLGVEGTHDIYVMSVDGSGVKRLTTKPIDRASPTWTPDEKIAFLRVLSESGGTGDIYLMSPDGSVVTRLTRLSDVGSLGWSADGTRIAIGEVTTGISAQSWIDVAQSDGAGATPITSGNLSAIDPAWSPDGRQIVFISSDQSDRIHVMKADGSAVTDLAIGENFVGRNPNWH